MSLTLNTSCSLMESLISQLQIIYIVSWDDTLQFKIWHYWKILLAIVFFGCTEKNRNRLHLHRLRNPTEKTAIKPDWSKRNSKSWVNFETNVRHNKVRTINLLLPDFGRNRSKTSPSKSLAFLLPPSPDFKTFLRSWQFGSTQHCRPELRHAVEGKMHSGRFGKK